MHEASSLYFLLQRNITISDTLYTCGLSRYDHVNASIAIAKNMEESTKSEKVPRNFHKCQIAKMATNITSKQRGTWRDLEKQNKNN